jgi:trans-aconitate methyltransferase
MSSKREIIGCDYDEEKISTANHRFSKSSRVQFIQHNLADFLPEPCSGIVISDVLHYLLPDERDLLLKRCAESLLPGGLMLIKDADSNDARHEKTLTTENWSTRFLKFNKTDNPLYFFSSDELIRFTERLGLQSELISSSAATSNKIWKFTKK